MDDMYDQPAKMEQDENATDEESSMSTEDVNDIEDADDDEEEQQQQEQEEEKEDNDNDSHNDENDVNEPSTSKGRKKRKIDDSPKRKRQSIMPDYFIKIPSSKMPENPGTVKAPTGGFEKIDEGKEKLDMSFYKLRWFSFKNYQDRNVKEVIEENFKRKDSELSFKWGDTGDKYSGFHIFYYQRKVCKTTAKKMPGVEPEKNINHEDLIFFFKADIKNPEYAFCLCSGRSYMLLEGHTESKFSKTMAKHFMDGNCLISKEVVCIAGPSISEHQTFSREAVLLIRGNYEKIITGLTAQIREETELAKIICEGKSVSMTLGQTKLKINKTLNLETFAKVLNLFINAYEHQDDFTTDPVMVAALDYTQYIGDPVKKKELDENLRKDALTDTGHTDVYLSNRKVEDWAHSSDIRLMCGKKQIQQWTSPPTFETMRKACDLSDAKAQIVFIAKDKSAVKGNLQDFLHGTCTCSIKDKKKQYHKVAGKWFWLSTKYRNQLANRMAIFLESNLIKQGEIGHLPLPWKPRSPPEIATTLEFLSQITRDRLLDWLKNKKVAYLGEDKISCLTSLNCKFIKSTSAFTDLKKILSPPTNKDNKTDKIARQQSPPTNKDEKLNVLQGLEHAMMVSAETEKPLSDCIKSCPIKEEIKKVLEEKQKEIITILQKKREVIGSKEEVVNPNVTEDLSKSILKDFFNNTVNCTPDVIGKELLCYLRTSCKNIEEGDYNETYQSIPTKDDESFYMLGDRVQGAMLPELFDVLYYKSKIAEESAKLYLYHIKEGFGPTTRVACSQIRVSANLLWNDLMDSSCTLPNVMKYREFALGYERDDICRIMLKRAMKNMTEDRFKSLFREVSEIVYVYAFMDAKKKDDYLYRVTGTRKLKVESEELDKLKMEGYVDKDGSLTDSAFLTTKESFMKQMKGELKAIRLTDIYSQMYEQTNQNPSTIALIELITLAEEFTKFQCPARRLSLKVCQISTCNT
ncbi:uncharacterized protein LOC110452537 [Mizuhopecten yessoensis]|uniref:uncharacterized protein LOC110452537 n=1 Tax=Mizuhopecten yessoensis TaxID=6573 RepID=UPI000B45BF6F|nr:uncharacterized protein LOC110452537 [Mizuhopecten yessoensis]XP_021356814.1 uncharacterized protein LOC110452537 [Mizuhopecten yessoensis]XP_021356815.1 uncharacterized protein LOC110452537 [Mizuhopecten yessoensis]XP_021356816.1 uncharacterized protein LOC110452537 [Mizuhopecten yessoensis]XP_021356817.1 uncharacterized protein LOC110452537 [Mizuhopecten yessoensis]XP_021356819.1 uncharacterized protein LOC110452537 [Mizuhopecten yessoensis]